VSSWCGDALVVADESRDPAGLEVRLRALWFSEMEDV
jgi:hypothetical protein